MWATLGASNHTDRERAEHDYYATDPLALDLLTRKFHIAKRVWEPACGGGHLSRWLEAHGHDVLSSDLVDRGFGFVHVDFLKTDKVLFGSWADGEAFDIVTNPPYCYATEFVLHALEIIPKRGRVVMLLRTSFLEGKQRREKIYD